MFMLVNFNQQKMLMNKYQKYYILDLNLTHFFVLIFFILDHFQARIEGIEESRTKILCVSIINRMYQTQLNSGMKSYKYYNYFKHIK